MLLSWSINNYLLATPNNSFAASIIKRDVIYIICFYSTHRVFHNLERNLFRKSFLLQTLVYKIVIFSSIKISTLILYYFFHISIKIEKNDKLLHVTSALTSSNNSVASILLQYPPHSRNVFVSNIGIIYLKINSDIVLRFFATN